jgi:glycosyltransferase involved in cell wall biosynthesis
MSVVVLTHFTSPYQIELFNAVAASGALQLEVIYLHQEYRTRQWTALSPHHRTLYLDEGGECFAQAQADILKADLAIFNYYAERPARLLLTARAVSGKPWCFWGERPGFHKPEWIGRLRRRYTLSRLHRSQAPIWGIGRLAVQQYQQEFGSQRPYCNLPYFSDLERFESAAGPEKRHWAERVFLFSGALIHRKGADVLGRAFVRLARELPHVRLQLLGEGDLRDALMQTLQPVRERVEFLGFKDWPELPACYAKADILCVPSRYDGWGLVVPEGLASGLPVIGTDRMGAAVELIETGRNGWLLPAGDEAALFAVMRQAAVLSPATLAELSQQARKSVSEHSLPHGVQRFVTAAREAMAAWQG